MLIFTAFLKVVMGMHTFNPCTWEAERGGPLILRLAWSMEHIPGQPGSITQRNSK